MSVVTKLEYVSVSPELIAYAVNNRHCYFTGVLDHTPSIYIWFTKKIIEVG